MKIEVIKRQVLLSVGDDIKSPPTEFRILKNGLNETTKGPIICDAQACAMVLGRYRKRKLDKLPFDAGHGMASGTDPRAYGWFEPDQNAGELWATKIKWNQLALDGFADSQFRFFSPWLYVGYEDGRAKELINIALTNIPATDGLDALVAADLVQRDKNENERVSVDVPVQLEAEQKEIEEMDPEVLKLLGALNCTAVSEIGPKVTKLGEHAATLAQTNTKLAADFATLQAQNAELATKVATLSSNGETAKRDALIVTLSTGTEAKLPPALKEWAQTQTYDQLVAYAKVAPVILASAAEIKQPAVTAPSAIDADAQSMLKMFGLASEEGENRFQEMQKHLSSHGGAFVPSEFTSKVVTPQQGAKH